MNKKLVGALLTSPSLFSFIGLNANMAQAAAVDSPAANTVSSSRTSERICGDRGCLAPAKEQALRASYKAQAANITRPQMIAKADGVIEYPMTDQESDAAIALFGCDCPSCVNAMRQLMGQAPYL